MTYQVNHLSSVQFHGTSTSQTECETVLGPDDLFLCTCGGESRSIDYATLRHQIVNDVFNTVFGVKSMAYRNKTEYALSSHVHGGLYNKMEISGQGGNVKLFTILNKYQSLPSSSTTISAYTIHGDKPVEPKPGTVKFVYGNKVPKTFPVDDTFDGWVYADGTKSEFTPYDLGLTNSEFMQLPSYQVLGNGNPSNPEIVIPKLTSFFKVSTGKITNMDIQGYSVGIPNHMHNVAEIKDISIKLKKSNESYIKTMTHKNKHAYGPHAGSERRSDT